MLLLLTLPVHLRCWERMRKVPLMWGRRTPSGRRQYVMLCMSIVTGLCLLGVWAVPTVSVSHHNTVFWNAPVEDP